MGDVIEYYLNDMSVVYEFVVVWMDGILGIVILV